MRWLFGLAALLGASIVIFPAVAGSETGPTIKAEDIGGLYGEAHAWSPAQVTVAAGGVVTLSNPTMVAHGVEWRPGGPATPSCEEGAGKVPVGTSEAASGKEWSGTCTFTQAGSYEFWCTVHHAAMRGTITVNATTTTTTTTSTPPASSGGGSATTAPTTAPESGPQTTSGSSGSAGSPLAGSASQAVKLAQRQHGHSVRGSVNVSQAGAGGRLEVDLLAKRASLANAAHPAQARVGRLVRSALQPGKVSFTVALDAKARHALAIHRRLALTVKIVLTPAHGSALAIIRRVVAHA